MPCDATAPTAVNTDPLKSPSAANLSTILHTAPVRAHPGEIFAATCHGASHGGHFAAGGTCILNNEVDEL